MLRAAAPGDSRTLNRLFAGNLRQTPESCKIRASAQHSSDLVSAL